MTRREVNHMLGSINALSPGQMRKLRQQLDRQLAQPKKPTGSDDRQDRRRARTVQGPTKAPSVDELHEKLMARGFIRRLPDPTFDIGDDRDDQRVPIKAEVPIVCSGGNMLSRHIKVALRSAKGDTETTATPNFNMLLNHA